MLNYKVTNNEAALMQEIMLDRKAARLLAERAIREPAYCVLRDYGDPRFWPEYLDNLHEPADIE